MGTTREELRTWIGDLIGDYRALAATSTTNTTTLRDTQNLARQDDALIGQYVFFTSGTNDGLQRRITDNDESDSEITFAAVTAAVTSGDTAELWNDRGTGVLPSTIHNHINRAIKEVGKSALSEASSDDYTFSYQAPVFDISQSTWLAIVKGAEWQDGNGAWHPIPGADVKVDAANRQVEFRGDTLWIADQRTIRLRGYTAATALSSDSESTELSPGWIVAQVCAWILSGTWHKRRDSREAQVERDRFLAEAEAKRPSELVLPRGNVVWLGQ